MQRFPAFFQRNCWQNPCELKDALFFFQKDVSKGFENSTTPWSHEVFLPGSLHVAHMPVLPYPHPGFGLILIFKPTRHKPLGRFGLEKTGSSGTCQMNKKLLALQSYWSIVKNLELVYYNVCIYDIYIICTCN